MDEPLGWCIDGGMTVIMSYATPEFVFIAVDSFRWDKVEKRNLGPVRKFHVAGRGSAFAMGGRNIDRTRLSAGMVEARRRGIPFDHAARTYSPALFQEKKEVLISKGLIDEQFVISFYVEVLDGQCEVRRHRLPEDVLSPVVGCEILGPDSQLLTQWAAACQRRHVKYGRLALDAWAVDLITQAAIRFPCSVGFPVYVIAIEADGSITEREIVDPEAWRGPSPAFSLAIDQ